MDVNTAETASPEGGDWKQVTITVDSSESNGRYDFQLFKTSKSVSFVTWKALEDCVKFDDGID